MVSIPAVCDNCGRMFPSGLGMSGNARVFVYGSKSGPCPYCGSMGSIPDGLYRDIDNVINYIADSNYSLEELVKLRNMLLHGFNENFNFQELTEETEKNGFSISDLLPQNREEARSDIFSIIQIILAVLGILIPLLMSNRESANVEINKEQVIEYIYNNPEEFKRMDDK